MDTYESLRTKQIDAIKTMLNPFADPQPDWKFIIYDNVGRDIMEQLFPNKELKSKFVTLHLLINSEREPVPEVASVYFVMPTDENIERICSDLKSHLYNCYYINFISALSNEQLKTIAEAAVQSESATEVRKVYSQHLNFIALEDNLFVLRESEKHLVSYHAIHRRDVSDSMITESLDHIVDCLFSLLVTLNIIPIIRSPRGGPAEVIAKKLAAKLRKSLQLDADKKIKGDDSLFKSKTNKSSGSSRRKLLCIVDRSVDMSTPLHHTWTYQALIHDLLNTELNRITIIDDSDKSKPRAQLFDLSPEDKFWREQRGNPFPQVAEAVQRELETFKRHKDELNGLKSSTVTVDKVIKDHTTIATAVLKEIKTRKLDNFFELEEKIMNRSQIDKVVFDEAIADPEYGQPNDKYRLFLIAYICDNPTLSEQEADKYVEILESFGCNRTVFEYIKNWKYYSKTNVASLQSSLKSSGGILDTAGMFTKLMSKGSQFVMEGVKNLVLKEHYLPLTKIVDGLMDSSSKRSRESLEYTYLDPNAESDHQVANHLKVFQDVIVFVVGGGNYIEYQNLLDYCRTKSKSTFASGHSIVKHMMYGSTDLVNANQFLHQLELVGQS